PTSADRLRSSSHEFNPIGLSSSSNVFVNDRKTEIKKIFFEFGKGEITEKTFVGVPVIIFFKDLFFRLLWALLFHSNIENTARPKKPVKSAQNSGNVFFGDMQKNGLSKNAVECFI